MHTNGKFRLFRQSHHQGHFPENLNYQPCYVDCQEEKEVSPKMYVYENWKSTSQTAIRGLMPHEIFSLYALDAVHYGRSS